MFAVALCASRRAHAARVVRVVTDPELAQPCRAALDRLLEPDEGVWAVLRGRDGNLLVGSDRRLFSLSGDCGGGTTRAWPYRELDDLRVVGSSVLVRTRVGGHHLTTVALNPDSSEQNMQAVTIIELLIARAGRH